MWAIIGGSGFEQFESFKRKELLDRDTPFGAASSGASRVQIGDVEAIFISRHGQAHELLPSEINYRANTYLMKREGVQAILALSTVGSLQKSIAPGHIVLPHQYLNHTCGIRKHTFCKKGIVGHVALGTPTCPNLQKQFSIFLKNQFSFSIHTDKTYLITEGPYFATQAESKRYQAQGGDIIGMTAFPEFALAREAGMCYFPVSFVTDYDSWATDLPHVTLKEVMRVMKQNHEKAFQIGKVILEKLPKPKTCTFCKSGSLKNNLLTHFSNLPSSDRPWLEVLFQ